ncbi:MAG: hypothetical protein IRY84_19450, partial [Thermobispora bispora]|nr:hypothetical protein [Thermobispora bispora]
AATDRAEQAERELLAHPLVRLTRSEQRVRRVLVAREYGIPAVMGTGTGTTVLTDGRLVTVDGDTGRVTGES